MAVGYALNGVCYPSTAQALAMFNVQYPQVSSDHIINLTSSSVAGSVLSYNLGVRQIDTNTITARAGSFTLLGCDSADWSYQTDYAWALIVGCVILFALGFKAGQS